MKYYLSKVFRHTDRKRSYRIRNSHREQPKQQNNPLKFSFQEIPKLLKTLYSSLG